MIVVELISFPSNDVYNDVIIVCDVSIYTMSYGCISMVLHTILVLKATSVISNFLGEWQKLYYVLILLLRVHRA